jgi:hypothetical protein
MNLIEALNDLKKLKDATYCTFNKNNADRLIQYAPEPEDCFINVDVVGSYSPAHGKGVKTFKYNLLDTKINVDFEDIFDGWEICSFDDIETDDIENMPTIQQEAAPLEPEKQVKMRDGSIVSSRIAPLSRFKKIDMDEEERLDIEDEKMTQDLKQVLASLKEKVVGEVSKKIEIDSDLPDPPSKEQKRPSFKRH